jgi:phosphatidate cytidylyltransferase
MLGQRIVTALILLAIIVPAIFFAAPWVWGVVSLAMLCAGALEWGRLMHAPRQGLMLAAGLAAAGALYLVWRGHLAQAPAPALAAIVCASSLAFWLSVALVSLTRVQRTGPGMAIGGLVLGAAWLSLYELRIESPLMLVSAMALVWLADIGAYFFGRTLGRHKLAPRVSPGKTWEGAAGGAAVVLTVAAGVALLWPSLATHVYSSHLISHLGWVATALALLLLTALSIVGDLYESLLKRVAGVKDSGRTLPGHGGVLDRVDALLPTMPACLLLLQLLR